LQSNKDKQLIGKLGGSFQPVGEVESVSKELSETFKKEFGHDIVFGTESPVVLQSGRTLHTEDIISIL